MRENKSKTTNSDSNSNSNSRNSSKYEELKCKEHDFEIREIIVTYFFYYNYDILLSSNKSSVLCFPVLCTLLVIQVHRLPPCRSCAAVMAASGMGLARMEAILAKAWFPQELEPALVVFALPPPAFAERLRTMQSRFDYTNALLRETDVLFKSSLALGMGTSGDVELRSSPFEAELRSLRLELIGTQLRHQTMIMKFCCTTLTAFQADYSKAASAQSTRRHSSGDAMAQRSRPSACHTQLLDPIVLDSPLPAETGRSPLSDAAEKHRSPGADLAKSWFAGDFNPDRHVASPEPIPAVQCTPTVPDDIVSMSRADPDASARASASKPAPVPAWLPPGFLKAGSKYIRGPSRSRSPRR